MPDQKTKTAILIAGPTASGKSAIALELAERLNGEIINADAIQVYEDLRILSARPSDEETNRAPHHLYGHVDGAVRYSTGDWARAAGASISDISERGKTPIIVGGTGLYFRAAIEGLSEIPPIPDAVRKAAAARFDAVGPVAFREEVIAFDPAMARLAPGDRQRHIRAWEVFKATGAPLSVLQKEQGTPLVDQVAARVIIEPDREMLYRRCEDRFDAMMAAGALDEANALAERRLDGGMPVMKALGAAELIAHIGGELTLEAAIDLAKRNTRRFAKRQLTWFRNQTADWPRASSPKEALAEIDVMLGG